MALSAFAGVFSRSFVVGYFLPAFFVLVLVSQLVDPASLPTAYESASGASQLAILGGTSLLAALILSGLNYHLIRLFEGYPIDRLGRIKPTGRIPWARRVVQRLSANMTGHWTAEFKRREAALEGPKSDERTRAARELNRYFPWRVQRILPTRLGNAIRAFETHSNMRYGLDGVTAWTRIEGLLKDTEIEAIADAQSDVAFFLNLAVLVPLGAAFVLVDLLIHPPGSPLAQVALALTTVAIGVVVTGLLYRALVAAAVRWGMPVRAAFDMHRLELYAQLGLKSPRTDVQERNIAKAATRMMLYGEPLDESVREKPKQPEEK